MERDVDVTADLSGTDISTHTLTWSVTVSLPSFLLAKSISTHTLTWSVT